MASRRTRCVCCAAKWVRVAHGKFGQGPTKLGCASQLRWTPSSGRNRCNASICGHVGLFHGKVDELALDVGVMTCGLPGVGDEQMDGATCVPLRAGWNLFMLVDDEEFGFGISQQHKALFPSVDGERLDRCGTGDKVHDTVIDVGFGQRLTSASYGPHAQAASVRRPLHGRPQRLRLQTTHKWQKCSYA